MEANDKFQGLCLEDRQGKDFIGKYDIMPPRIRELVRNSSFNICAACLQKEANQRARKRNLFNVTEIDYKIALKKMEDMIRKMETQ